MELVVAIMVFDKSIESRNGLFASQLAETPVRFMDARVVMNGIDEQPSQGADQLAESHGNESDIQESANRRSIRGCLTEPAADRARIRSDSPEQNKPREHEGNQQAEVVRRDVSHSASVTRGQCRRKRSRSRSRGCRNLMQVFYLQSIQFELVKFI